MNPQIIVIKCLKCKKEQQVLRLHDTEDLPVCCGWGMQIIKIWELVFSV